jgi:hypothetical protein
MSGGVKNAAPAPGALLSAYGWTDYSGNVWSQDSSNYLRSVSTATPWIHGLLYRAEAIEQTPDMQVTATWQCESTVAGTGDLYVCAKVNNPGSSVNMYAASVRGDGTYAVYPIVAGVQQAALSGGSGTTFTPVNGTVYRTQLNVTTVSGTSTIVVALQNSGGGQLASWTYTDTTAALQTISGGAGIYFNNPTSTNIGVSALVTASDQVATGYVVTLPTTATVNSGSFGTLSLVGGPCVSTPLVVTFADDALGAFQYTGQQATQSYTINSSSGPTLPIVYIPIAAGSRTVSWTHTGGSGLTGDGSQTVVASVNAAIQLVSDTTFSGGPVLTSPTPGLIGHGFTDVLGNQWSIDSNNFLRTVGSGLLERSLAAEASVNSTMSTTLVWGSITTGQMYHRHRYFKTSGNDNGYLVGLNASGSTYPFNQVNGGFGEFFCYESPAITFTLGASYTWTTSVYQTNATTTTVTGVLTDASGTVLLTVGALDTTPSLQNASGQCGVWLGGVSTANIDIWGAQRIRTYSDHLVNGYSLTIGSNAMNDFAIPGTISISGGGVLANPLSVTLSDGAGGAFYPNPVTLSATAGTTVPVAYTPVSPGSHTITASHSGGNASISDATTATVFVSSSILTNDPACVLSPYNWTIGGRGSGSAQTWNTGAYARFYFKNCTSVTLFLDMTSYNNTAQNPFFTYCLDNGVLATPINLPSTGQLSISVPDTGSHCLEVYLDSIPQAAGRWARTLFFGIQGIGLSSSGTSDPASVVQGQHNLLIYGDSITEGILANNGVDGVIYDYSFMLGQYFRILGFEYGIVACGFQGYSGVGVGGVPCLFVEGNDSLSSWNKIDAQNSRVSGGQITPAPDIIFEAMGTNDGLYGNGGNHLTPPLAQQITAFYQALRAAAPKALLINMIPWSGLIRSDINSAMAAYAASAPSDTKAKTVDFHIDSRMGSSPNQYCFYGGGLHLGLWGHANVASLTVGAVEQLYLGSPQSTARLSLFRRA